MHGIWLVGFFFLFFLLFHIYLFGAEGEGFCSSCFSFLFFISFPRRTDLLPGWLTDGFEDEGQGRKEKERKNRKKRAKSER